MREMRRNIIVVGVILIALFVMLAVYFLYDSVVFSGRWIGSAYNRRLEEMRQTTIPGGIYDRNEVMLAGVKHGKRIYAEDRTLRLAVSHAVGDPYGFCSTGVEMVQGPTLLHYNEGVIDYVIRLVTGQERRGSDVTLTLDSMLNQKAVSLLGSNEGAVVVMNYKTGEILCLASAPTFDPITIDPSKASGGTSGDILVNRAVQGQYAPGSVFKVITAAAAIEKLGWLDETFLCEGELATGGREVTCPREHGELTLSQAFAQSCNTSFANIGLKVGYKDLVNQGRKAGFNRSFLFDDVVLYGSKIALDRKSSEQDVAFAAIGQHDDITSPLHMAMLASAVANHGMMMEPKMVQGVEGKQQVVHPKMYLQAFERATADKLEKMMALAVSSGTARNAALQSVEVCGKTGTAEVSEDEAMPPHSWFMGYVNDDEHPLAIAVIVEHGGAGSQVATPLARKMLAYALELGY